MKKKQSFNINIGTVSLIVIFSILCLTIFSMLSLSTASVEKKLAEKTSRSISCYYVADLICTEKVSKIKQLVADNNNVFEHPALLPELDNTNVTKTTHGIEISFVETIDQVRELYVVIEILSNDTQIKEWKVRSIGEWRPDDSLDLWSGGE